MFAIRVFYVEFNTQFGH